MPIGQVTRGTTGTNRLRRMDRWIAVLPQLRRPDALVVDLGYGASATTDAPNYSSGVCGLPVVGLEISPEQVATLSRTERGRAIPPRRVRARRGSPTIVRAANVLRQYKEEEVLPTWRENGGAPAIQADS